MIRFNNDYNRGAHPAVLKALNEDADCSYGGYGDDPWCEKAVSLIREACDAPDADVHFLLGGTQANFVLIAAALRPYQSVLSAASGHINAHEAGAVENTGHKIEVLPSVNGKIDAAHVEAAAKAYAESTLQEHFTQPKLVYISFPTEYGTIYSKDEITALRKVCDEYGLYLFIDGARLGYGLGSPEADVTLADLAVLADAFYIGGTKCGAMMGEALVITRPELKTDFRSYMKQNGAILAKGWLLGLQFATLFKDNLYLEITAKAVKLAMDVKAAFAARGIDFYMDSPTNQQFVMLTEAQMAKFAGKYTFEDNGAVEGDEKGRHCVRFCVAWSSTEEEVAELIRDIEAL